MIRNRRFLAGAVSGVLFGVASWQAAGASCIAQLKRDIPSAGTNGAVSVFAVDLNADGETDVLSASFGDNKIAWYESDGADPPIFTQRIITTAAFGAVKTLLNETFEHGLETQMELEARAIADMSATADGQEGIRAFLDKRKPEFKGG